MWLAYYIWLKGLQDSPRSDYPAWFNSDQLSLPLPPFPLYHSPCLGEGRGRHNQPHTNFFKCLRHLLVQANFFWMHFTQQGLLFWPLWNLPHWKVFHENTTLALPFHWHSLSIWLCLLFPYCPCYIFVDCLPISCPIPILSWDVYEHWLYP